MIRREFLLAGGSSLLLAPQWLRAQAPPVEMRTLRYASPGGIELLLDLYRPVGKRKPLPVIVFVHGGGWTTGTRTTGPDFKRFFAQDGFAIAAIEYRLTPAITFPANVEDVKTAIRWLRKNANEHGLDPRRIGLWGTSAGGHLAAVAALTPRGKFEGGDNPRESSEVRCVLDAYGPSSFNVMDAQTELESPTLQKVPAALVGAPAMIAGTVPPAGATGLPRPVIPLRAPHDDATSAESKLVGAPIQTVPEKVKAASPLTYVTRRAPPFLLMHGLADDAVPHHQSVLLYEALKSAGTNATLRLIDGLLHTFFNRSNLDELAGPFRMDVSQSQRGREKKFEERANVFDVARDFFRAHLL